METKSHMARTLLEINLCVGIPTSTLEGEVLYLYERKRSRVSCIGYTTEIIRGIPVVSTETDDLGYCDRTITFHDFNKRLTRTVYVLPRHNTKLSDMNRTLRKYKLIPKEDIHIDPEIDLLIEKLSLECLPQYSSTDWAEMDEEERNRIKH